MQNAILYYTAFPIQNTSENIGTPVTFQDLVAIVGAGAGKELLYCLRAIDECREMYEAYHHPTNLQRETKIVSNLLSCSRNTVYKKLNEWNLTPDDFRRETSWEAVALKSTIIQQKIQQLIIVRGKTESAQ